MKFKPLLLVLACTTLLPIWATAQNTTRPAPPSKPAAKPAQPAPAAQDRTPTLGGGSGSAAVRAQPILTRDELRACLKQEEAIRLRLAEHEASRAPIDQARQGITAQQDALRAERAQVDEVNATVQAFRAKMEAHSRRVQTWNTDVEAFNTRKPAGQTAERERLRLNTEREALQKAQADLEAERKQMTEQHEKIITAFNVKVREVEAAVAGWNQRNQAWNEAGARLEDERKGWVASCADRRYREEDEIAIKSGR